MPAAAPGKAQHRMKRANHDEGVAGKVVVRVAVVRVVAKVVVTLEVERVVMMDAVEARWWLLGSGSNTSIDLQTSDSDGSTVPTFVCPVEPVH